MASWFAYQPSRNIAATRHFYGTLLGLAEIWHEPDSVAFAHDGVQLSFHRTPDLAPVEGWAFQPGWALGLPDPPPTSPTASTSIALPPEAFAAAVERLRATDADSLRPAPFWVGYWSFVVRDPDGRTVELSDPASPER